MVPCVGRLDLTITTVPYWCRGPTFLGETGFLQMQMQMQTREGQHTPQITNAASFHPMLIVVWLRNRVAPSTSSPAAIWLRWPVSKDSISQWSATGGRPRRARVVQIT